MLQTLLARIFGTWCQALDPDGEASCWERVSADQPGSICDDCWVLLATHGSTAQRLELAGEPDVPPPAADILAQDPSGAVRGEYAASDALLAEHRSMLALEERDAQVTRRLARRYDLTADDQRALSRTDDVITLRVLAGNRTTDHALRTMLSTHPDDGVRNATAAAAR